VTSTPTLRMADEEGAAGSKSEDEDEDFQAKISAFIHDPDIVRRLGLARKEKVFEEYLDRDKGIIKSMHSMKRIPG